MGVLLLISFAALIWIFVLGLVREYRTGESGLSVEFSESISQNEKIRLNESVLEDMRISANSWREFADILEMNLRSEEEMINSGKLRSALKIFENRIQEESVFLNKARIYGFCSVTNVFDCMLMEDNDRLLDWISGAFRFLSELIWRIHWEYDWKFTLENKKECPRFVGLYEKKDCQLIE